jgi:hypothetical protein
MSNPNAVLSQASALIESRLDEIRQEEQRLRSALGSLDGSRRGPGRPRGSRKTDRRRTGSGGGRRRGRRGQRPAQALKVVQANPGTTATQVAKEIGVAPSYVYRVMAGLVEKGEVVKEGRSYRVSA